MPLVQFVYNHTFEVKDLTPPTIDNFKQTITIPFNARQANWKIKSVTACLWTEGGNQQDMRWIEIEFPQLMREDLMFYSINSVGNDTPEPARNLRFYVNKFQLDSAAVVSNVPNLLCTDSRPDLSLGHHILDSQELTMIISAVNGRGADTKTSLTQYNVILEYE
jgi:hypothetical protein